MALHYESTSGAPPCGETVDVTLFNFTVNTTAGFTCGSGPLRRVPNLMLALRRTTDRNGCSSTTTDRYSQAATNTPSGETPPVTQPERFDALYGNGRRADADGNVNLTGSRERERAGVRRKFPATSHLPAVRLMRRPQFHC